MGKTKVASVAAALLLAAVLSGCGAQSNAEPNAGSDADVATQPAPTPSPSASTASHWPAGASASTAECQDASAAVVAAINATIDNPLPGGSQVDWITAHPDPELGKWLLTGLLATSGTEGGYFVVWASSADPTAADFAGELSTVGGSTAQVSSAPPMVPAFQGPSDMEDVPAAALACGGARSRRDAGPPTAS